MCTNAGRITLILLVLLSTASFAAPSAPTLAAPADEAKNQSITPTLSWSAVSGASSYQVQVSTDKDFTSTIFDESAITGTSVAVNGLDKSIIAVGAPYNDGRPGGFWNDQPLAYYIKPDGVTLRSWHTFMGGGLDMIEGTIDQPTRSRVGSYSWSWNGITGHGHAWVMRPYEINGDTLLGFIHIETERPTGGRLMAYGLAVSFNMGNSWSYLGDIHNLNSTANPGGGPVLLVDGYLYAYFNNGGPAVARAPRDSVFAAAKQRRMVPWFKYYNGQWNSPSVTGQSSRLFTVSGSPSSADLHSHATHIRSIGTYLLAVNNHGTNARCLFFISKDGVNWTNQYTVATGGNNHPYHTFVGTKATGARNDQSEQGNSFWCYWTQKTSDYNNDTFKRVKIDVYPKVYYWRVRASDAGGAGAWSTVRSFTTEATIAPASTVQVSAPASESCSRSWQSGPILKTTNRRIRLEFGSSGRRDTSPIELFIYNTKGQQLKRATVSSNAGSVECEFDDGVLVPGRYTVRVRQQRAEWNFPLVISRL